eukprot:tig00021493_g21892.t1
MRARGRPRPVAASVVLALLAVAILCAGQEPSDWQVPECEPLTTDVHAFFYSWYGNPQVRDTLSADGFCGVGPPSTVVAASSCACVVDGKWIHWDHEFLREEKTRGRHDPDRGDLASPYYPALGAYSSADPATVRAQLKQVKCAGIGTISYSWWGRGKADGQGGFTDRMLNMTLAVAHEEGVLVNIHLEPYEGRSTGTIREDLGYIAANYGWSAALQRVEGRPVLYVYDSYHIPYADWREVLLPGGAGSVRGTGLDGFFVGLVCEPGDDRAVLEAGFDAGYSYFATEGFTYGSTARHWPRFVREAEERGRAFIPSIGPGYDDLQIRTWNGVNLRERGANGEYYEAMFEQAMQARPRFLTITSFNEQGEGTAIEAAVPRKAAGRGYKDYGPHGPDFYLRKTRALVARFLEARASWYPALYGAGPGGDEL